MPPASGLAARPLSHLPKMPASLPSKIGSQNELKRWIGNSVCRHCAVGSAFAFNGWLDQEPFVEMVDERLDRFGGRAGEFVRRLSSRAGTEAVLFALLFWRIRLRTDVHLRLSLSRHGGAPNSARRLNVDSRGFTGRCVALPLGGFQRPVHGASGHHGCFVRYVVHRFASGPATAGSQSRLARHGRGFGPLDARFSALRSGLWSAQGSVGNHGAGELFAVHVDLRPDSGNSVGLWRDDGLVGRRAPRSRSRERPADAGARQAGTVGADGSVDRSPESSRVSFATDSRRKRA